MTKMARGTPEQKAMAQDALNRFWYPSLMMFGPSDKDSVHSAQSMAWRIKINTNDELRQKFVDQTVPQAHYLGLTVPDDKLAWNEEKQGYDFSEPDWREFYDVVAGNGPCNRDRLAARVKAWEDGAWFRDGLTGACAQEARAARGGEDRGGIGGAPCPTNGRCGKCSSGASTASTIAMSASCTPPDAEQAIRNARDVYTRRHEGVSIWVVRSNDIVASSPSDKGPLFEPANSKVYRHPTFYDIPDEVGPM